MKGIDCSTTVTKTLAKQLKGKGMDFVIRYIMPEARKSWKAMSPKEMQTILDEGLKVGLVFERTADRTKGGAKNGVEDGKLALVALKELKIPLGVTVYFACDYDAPASQHNNIEAYLRSVSAELPTFNIGVYGSYSVVEEMLDRKVVKSAWQTVAWSRGNISKRSVIYQRQIDVKIAGINLNLDHNDSYGNEGFMSPKSAVTSPQTKPIAPAKGLTNKKAVAVPSKAVAKKVAKIKSVGSIKVANLKNFTYIYSKPNSDSKVIGKALLNSTYSIAGSVPDWYEVIVDNKRAYVSAKYAKRV